jgi:nuclear-control-of-ATPase protein 2
LSKNWPCAFCLDCLTNKNLHSQVRRIDSQLDRLQLAHASHSSEDFSTADLHTSQRLPRILALQRLVKHLSTTASATAPLSSTTNLLYTLTEAQFSTDTDSGYENELEWLLLSKATAQVYGQVLNTILEQTLAVNQHLWYWDDILSSQRSAGLYSLQTSPLRLWSWAKDVYQDVRAHRAAEGLEEGWRQFYGLVQDSIRNRSIATLQAGVVSPIARVRNEARQNQKKLRHLREINANALGLLLGEGLSSETLHEDGTSTPSSNGARGRMESGRKWKGAVMNSIALIDAVLSHVQEPEADLENFEDQILSTTRDDRFYVSPSDGGVAAFDELTPAQVSVRVQDLLRNIVPSYTTAFESRLQVCGQPSRLIRYWLPATVLVLSSSTILRIVANRKEEILTWIQELGATCMDFWYNWVVDPIKNIIGTIRHDEDSQVAIMSKRSLEGDRESLERMVVEFAVDENRNLTSDQLSDIRTKVHEGDLTPVLKAYERDMAKPFVGAIRGNLIRALLVQIQKTKVDVEVAIGGIDSLLKSQQLVFGFIALTPGLLVSIGAVRYLNGVLGNQKGNKKGAKQNQVLGVLRYARHQHFHRESR